MWTGGAKQRRTCLATQYSSISGSLVWWNISGSSVESDTFSPTAKNSWNGFLLSCRKSALFESGESASPTCARG